MRAILLRSPHSHRLLRSAAAVQWPLYRILLSSTSTTKRIFSSVARPVAADNSSVDEDAWERRPSGSESPSTAQPSRKDPLSKSAEPPSRLGGSDEQPQEMVIRSQSSPSEVIFTGDAVMPITSRLHIFQPSEDTPRGTWPIFRIMDEDGHYRDPTMDGYKFDDDTSKPQPPNHVATPPPAKDDLLGLRSWLRNHNPAFESMIEQSLLLQPARYAYPDMPTTDNNNNNKNPLLRAHRQMLRIREMDTLLQDAQRQGRISFYMTCRGEEAIHFGAASALDLGDVILAQYREAGFLMWRGFSLQQFADQCFSNHGDLGLGRQMPVHYGSRALNYQTISSPLGTQLPQSVGAGYRLKLQGKPNVAVCLFGDGAASTTDFHSALNFAAALHVPTVFVCRNNGYAISTPVTEQYVGDGIVSRAPGYGMAGLRVDGNDIFAVHAAVREARDYAAKNSAPVLVEAMTYRQGHHSTSDDSSRYRNAKEVQGHATHDDPVVRLNSFLKHAEWMTDEAIQSMSNEEKLAVLRAMEEAEHKSPPPLDSLFEDVYHDMPPHLQRQEAHLKAHIAKYPDRYKSPEKH